MNIKELSFVCFVWIKLWTFLNKAKKIGIDKYKTALIEKVKILEYVIKNYDGRKKGFLLSGEGKR